MVWLSSARLGGLFGCVRARLIRALGGSIVGGVDSYDGGQSQIPRWISSIKRSAN